MSTNRRLAAIMVADVVGYSRLMEADEAGTLTALKDRRKAVLEPIVKTHGGRIVKVMGDGVLVEFASAVNALQAAIELQKKMASANADVAEMRQVILRIGINLGDVVVDSDDLLGEGVNVAARLEQLCEPGGVLISGTTFDQLQGKLPCHSIMSASSKSKTSRVRFEPIELTFTIAVCRGARRLERIRESSSRP